MYIKTKKGKKILIDAEDYNLLSKYNWHISNGYARSINVIKGRNVLMHRFLMNVLNENTLIDHKDRNKLNNKKSNLRKSSPSENQKNKKSSGKVPYLGVSIHVQYRKYIKKNGTVSNHKLGGKYLAHIKINGKYKHLGLFDNAIDAAKCYDENAKKYHGEFANLNFK